MLLTPSNWAQSAVEDSQEDGLYTVIGFGLMGVVYNLKQCKMGPLLREYVKGMGVRSSRVINNFNQGRLGSDYTWSDVAHIIGDFGNHEEFMSLESDPRVKQEVANLAFFYTVAAERK
jgi:hypothetical protein